MCRETEVFGRALRQACQRTGVSQKDAALTMGVDQADLSRVYAGVTSLRSDKWLRLPPRTVRALFEELAPEVDALVVPDAMRALLHRAFTPAKDQMVA